MLCFVQHSDSVEDCSIPFPHSSQAQVTLASLSKLGCVKLELCLPLSEHLAALVWNMTGPWQAACRNKEFEHPQLLHFTPSLLLQAPDPLSGTLTKSWGQEKLQSLPGPVCQGPWVSTQCSYSRSVEIKVACAAEVLSSLPFHPGITGKCRSGETPGGQLNQSSTRTTWHFFRWAHDGRQFQTWARWHKARRETLQPPHGPLWRNHSPLTNSPKQRWQQNFLCSEILRELRDICHMPPAHMKW